MSASGSQFLGGAEPPPSDLASGYPTVMTAAEELSLLRRSHGRRSGRWGRKQAAAASDLAVAAAVAIPGDDDDFDGAESVAPTESVAGTDLVSEVGHEMEAEGFGRLEEVMEEEEQQVEEVTAEQEEQVEQVEEEQEEQPAQVQEFAFRSAIEL